MAFHCYYKVDVDPTVYEFTDEYNWIINDPCERETLFIMLANDHYGYNPDIWNVPYHDMFVTDEYGNPIRAMQVEMHLTPEFDAYDRMESSDEHL